MEPDRQGIGSQIQDGEAGARAGQNGGGASEPREAVSGQGEGVQSVDAHERTDVLDGVEVEIEDAQIGELGSEVGGEVVQA